MKILLADFVAHAIHPFPSDAESPIVGALQSGGLRAAAPFLPDGFFSQPLLSEKELCALALALRPVLSRLTEDMQNSIG